MFLMLIDAPAMQIASSDFSQCYNNQIKIWSFEDQAPKQNYHIQDTQGTPNGNSSLLSQKEATL